MSVYKEKGLISPKLKITATNRTINVDNNEAQTKQ